jgi:hypothetical protein
MLGYASVEPFITNTPETQLRLSLSSIKVIFVII